MSVVRKVTPPAGGGGVGVPSGFVRHTLPYTDRIVYSSVDLGLAAGDDWPRGQNAPAGMEPFSAVCQCPRCGELALHWLEKPVLRPPTVRRITPEYVTERAEVQTFGAPAYIRVVPSFRRLDEILTPNERRARALGHADAGPSFPYHDEIDLDKPDRWRYELSHADERAIEVWRRCRRSPACQHRWPQGSAPY